MTYEEQYLTLLKRTLKDGAWVENERTGDKCLTVVNADFVYNSEPPLLTTKQSFPIMAVAEMIGYLRGYTDAQKFADIGTLSWYGNSNETQAWLNNPNRKGENSMGNVYGAVAQEDIKKVFSNLSKGIDDRGEIITFWKPERFDEGCLRPCMHTHQFTLLNGKVYLHSSQRSGDICLGLPANAIQCWWLLQFAARVSGYEVGCVYHRVANAHIYESHIEGVKEQLSRPELNSHAKMSIPSWVKSLSDVQDSDKHAREYVTVEDYDHQGKIAFKMSV